MATWPYTTDSTWAFVALGAVLYPSLTLYPSPTLVVPAETTERWIITTDP